MVTPLAGALNTRARKFAIFDRNSRLSRKRYETTGSDFPADLILIQAICTGRVYCVPALSTGNYHRCKTFLLFNKNAFLTL